MNDALMYFLKVNVAIALFYLFFRLAFYNDTFWKTRRFYLVFSILISALYPLISFTDWLEKQEPMQAIVVSYAQLQEITVTPTLQKPSILTVENILLALYALVSMVLLVKMLVQLVSILRWRWKGKKQLLQGIEIISVKEKITPFSFFNMIFINPALHNEHEITQILTHEQTHARQLHSLDVLISELLTIVCWINPAAWLLRREIRQNLEFLADNSVLESGIDSKNYQYHLLELSYQTPDVKLGNKFNVSPLKKRITMMNQQKTAKAGLLKYSLIVPLALALILSSNAQTIVNSAKKAVTATKNLIVSTPTKTVKKPTTNSNKESSDDKTDLKKVYTVVEKNPQYPGGDKALLEFISNNVRYPAIAMENGIMGKVMTRFIVSESGKVENPEIVKGVDPNLDKEALRVLKGLADFTPGEQNGKKVAVWYNLPITFRLVGDQKIERMVFSVVEKNPTFPGGDKALLEFISNNVRYPIEAMQQGIQGKVMTRFIVSESGKVESPEILRSLDPTTDAAAIKVIKSLPDFIPGEQNGNKVAVWYNLPITFRLTDEKTTLPVVYEKVDKMPQYPGGDQALLKYISQKIVYPAQALETGTQGKVIIRFVVGADGSLNYFTVLKSVMEKVNKLGEIVVVGFGKKTDEKTQTAQTNMVLLEREAIRVVSTLQNFIPAENEGKKVAVYYQLPVTFKLE